MNEMRELIEVTPEMLNGMTYDVLIKPEELKPKKCDCGSVQFTYGGKCLACGKTKEEQEIIRDLLTKEERK